MKNFKAKEFLKKEHALVETDDICYCCKKKETPRIMVFLDTYWDDIEECEDVDYKYICLDCLQYEGEENETM